MEGSVQNCMAELKRLASSAAEDPRPAAAQIVRKFKEGASKKDREGLKAALEDARLIGLNTTVPAPFLTEHSRWLAAIEGARAAV
ncbi:MAG TPA: hypothetical protein VET89_04660 [Stellaceae bacterium]|nr:hypothetical protein [Stellaceae bacterium]